MQKFQTLQDAIALAEFAHRNQVDKAGMPYVDHPKRVLATVQAQGARPYVQIAAVLHDVVEDTPFTLDHLLHMGFSESAVRLVALLTRTDTVTQDDYYRAIGKNQDATIIKLADIADNTLEWRLSHLSDETQSRLRVKYAKARSLIERARYTNGSNWFDGHPYVGPEGVIGGNCFICGQSAADQIHMPEPWEA